ncbi:MAG TPA: hypothetical protein VFS36_06425 [Chitinophagaceae bacterium]|nr:hypothetical protein [Chitinophagaceae bacterium]
MKKTIAVLAVAATLVAFTSEKFFTLKFNEADLNKHYNKLEMTKKIVNESNLPHQQVVFIVSSIDSLQMEIVQQVQVQLKDTTKKK